jgi:DNA-binding response OmpR family regulator
MNPEPMILLVEDNPDHELLTIRALKKNNIANNVKTARDGQEALDFLLPPEGGPRVLPHVVLLDLKLPKIDGLEVLKRLRADKRTKLLPVVVLTSSDEEEDMIKSYEFGANSYIRKPVDFTKFIEATKQLGIYWLMLNEAPVPGKLSE